MIGAHTVWRRNTTDPNPCASTQLVAPSHRALTVATTLGSVGPAPSTILAVSPDYASDCIIRTTARPRLHSVKSSVSNPVQAAVCSGSHQCVRALRPTGSDSMLYFRHATSRDCYTACALSEPGQSGQAAFEMRGTIAYIRAVLSHGLARPGCGDFDRYTELDRVRTRTRCDARHAMRYLPPSARPKAAACLVVHRSSAPPRLQQRCVCRPQDPHSLPDSRLAPQVNYDFVFARKFRTP